MKEPRGVGNPIIAKMYQGGAGLDMDAAPGDDDAPSGAGGAGSKIEEVLAGLRFFWYLIIFVLLSIKCYLLF
ncbi:hypothetical protein MtrunA17_Chr2g0299831 [Medicago truncatula]|uniref:Transmembrane protein n=1 Tax=Medicago truncatula TaxID=3880 RepID=A0A396J891_MEDTR|nr:hypothetical protein MtrunA17_Chr2g0299831 [Medicago truncatula]